jgi:hypothetical protein
MATVMTVHGLCVDCEQEVIGGEGVVVDATGQVWHTDCRRVYLRKNRQPQQETVKRGPGRPRKTEEQA